jgi:hypothetical protein
VNSSWLGILRLLGGLALLWPAVCKSAESPRVLLVYPAEAQPPVSAALVRVRGELVADGFDVVLLRAKPGTSSVDAMGQAESNVDSATVGLFLSADGTSAELWVVDKLTDKTVVRRVNTASESSSQLSEVLAMRAVELLRASLLEFLIAQRHTEEPPSAPRRPEKPVLTREVERKATEWAAKPLARSPSWSVEAGPSLLTSPGQVAPQIGLAVSVGVHLFPALRLRVSSIGLGSRAQVTGTGGSARVQQWYGLGEIVALPWPMLRVSPTFMLGAGAHHLGVDGNASWPYQSVNSAVWTLALEAGLGLQWKLSERIALAGEGHVLLSVPYPNLYFVGRSEARVGQPALVASGTLMVSL